MAETTATERDLTNRDWLEFDEEDFLEYNDALFPWASLRGIPMG